MPSIPSSVRMRTRISLALGTMKLLTQCGRPVSGARRIWISSLVIFIFGPSEFQLPPHRIVTPLDRSLDTLCLADVFQIHRFGHFVGEIVQLFEQGLHAVGIGFRLVL